MYPNWAPGYHNVSFGSDDQGVIARLKWGYDKAVPAGEVFYKQLNTAMTPNKI